MTWLRFPRVVGVVACAYLIVVTGYFGWQTSLRFRWVSSAEPVVGEVVALVPRPLAGSTRVPDADGRGVPYAPQVRYQVGGRTFTYTPDHGSVRRRYAVGDKVTVLYDRDDPARARLRGEGRILLPVITAGFATTAVALGAVLLWSRRVADSRPAR